MTVSEAVALGGVLVSAGMALGSIAALRERVNRLERGGEDQGRRLGKLERMADVQRALTGARGVPVTPNPDEA